MSYERDYFYPQARKDIAKFPKEARMRIAGLLDMLRNGLELMPKDFKSMPTVGSGVYELRVRVKTQYRVFYVTKFRNGIYVLHAFNKKTQKTSQREINIGKKRYDDLIALLKRGNKNGK